MMEISQELFDKIVFENTKENWLEFIETFGHEIIAWATMGGAYDGDCVAVFKIWGKPNQYGLFMHGYGSCSGCDDLFACETLEEMIVLQEKLYNTIRWFSNIGELQEWIKNNDWSATHWGCSVGERMKRLAETLEINRIGEEASTRIYVDYYL